MADVIKFRCKGCEKKISVRAEYAGKKVKCPGCEQPLLVPSPRPKRSATGVPVAAGAGEDPSGLSGGLGSGISLAELAAMEENADAEIKELSSKAAAQPANLRVPGGKECPGCAASVKPEAVICVHCGHSFESGKRLKTKKDSKLGKAVSSVASSVGDEEEGLENTWKYLAPTLFFFVAAIACYTGMVGLLDGFPHEKVQGVVDMYKDDGGATSGTFFLVLGFICVGVWFVMKRGWRRFAR